MKTSRILPVNKPLTPAILQRVSEALAAQSALPSTTIDSGATSQNTSQTHSRTPNQAAILVPLVNIDDKPSILFQVRANLRMHSGEVR